MTDETKNLFDAPWSAYPLDDVGDANGNFVCSCETPEMAHRLARLPELYDACVEAVYYRCFDCLGGFRHDIGLTSEDLLNDGCPKKSNNCFFLKTIDLLRKVRAGK